MANNKDLNTEGIPSPSVNEVFRLESNYFRIASLILELGTQVIRDAILAHLPLGETLQSLLERPAIYHKLEGLHQRGVIVEKQWNILYPTADHEAGSINMEDIDINLWMILMKNLIPKSHRFRKVTSGYLEESWIDNVFVLKEIRNKLFHLPKPELDDNTYLHFWRKATDAISSIDPRIKSFNKFKDSTYDEQKLKTLQKLINEQALTEQVGQLKSDLGSQRRIVRCLAFTVILAILILATAITLVVYLTRDEKSCQKYRRKEYRDILTIVERRGWKARDPTPGMTPMNTTANIVIYTHTAESAGCYDSDDCCAKVNEIQYQDMHKEGNPYSDIGLHYFIDQRGIVYEGRSIKYRPAIVFGHNRRTLAIGLIGNFVYQRDIPWQMISSFVYLVMWLVEKGDLEKTYDLYAICEFRNTISPGQYMYDVISCDSDCPIGEVDDIFKHVRHTNNSFCPVNLKKSKE